MLFTVTASADGDLLRHRHRHRDLGDIGLGSHDRACLTVATPTITITKVDAPDSVIPGHLHLDDRRDQHRQRHRHDVVISDALGFNPDGHVRAIYVSSSLNGIAGTLTNSVISSNRISIPGGGSVTFTVVSRIPRRRERRVLRHGDRRDQRRRHQAGLGLRRRAGLLGAPGSISASTSTTRSRSATTTYFSTLLVEPQSNEGVSTTS